MIVPPNLRWRNVVETVIASARLDIRSMAHVVYRLLGFHTSTALRSSHRGFSRKKAISQSSMSAMRGMPVRAFARSPSPRLPAFGLTA